MNSTSPLTGSHLRTYDRIFQHPVSHNLGWNDVYALFRVLGQVDEEPNGNMKIRRAGQEMSLRPHGTKDVAETEELMELRHFLERTETKEPVSSGEEGHFLLVIDHHVARLYRSEIHGSVPEKILPHKPEDYFRHAHNSRDFSRGQEKPDPNSFFEPVALALKGARQVLVFGTGTGTSSEMEQFIAWARVHHADLAGRIIGSLVIDENHLSEGQLLSKAREFYSSARIPSS